MLNRPPESMLGDGKGFATQAELDERGVNVKQFGAVGDGTTDDTVAIQDTINYVINNGGTVFIPPGKYRTTSSINIPYGTYMPTVQGVGQNSSVIVVDHLGDGMYITTNNKPLFKNFKIERSTIDTVFNRTGTGLKIVGDVANGSSIQISADNVRIEGFSKGLHLAGCFLSDFTRLTIKRNDISYYFENDTNNSITFTACASNNSVGQHIVGDPAASGVGLSQSGATFISCEFENANRFPYFHVKSGNDAIFRFIECYTYENNFDNESGTSYHAYQFDIPVHLTVVGGAIDSTGKQDARLIYGRKNGKVAKWDFRFMGVLFRSRRVSAGQEIDVDQVTESSGDFIMMDTTCTYWNSDDPSHDVASYGTMPVLYKDRYFSNHRANHYLIHGLPSGVRLTRTGNNFYFENGTNQYNYSQGHIALKDYNNEFHLFIDGNDHWRVKKGNPASSKDGNVVQIIKSGVSTSRPALDNYYVGFEFFDTDLGKPIWFKGNSTWVDATGTAV